MQSQFSIWIVSPPGYIHSRCFEEVAMGLQAAFKGLGYNVPVITDPAGATGRIIVLGANLLHRIDGPLPSDLILYNLEQIQKDSPWLINGYIDLLRQYTVWDYSGRNIEILRRDYAVNATLCGIGYVPDLTRVVPQEEDIDVLFVGSVNDRRRFVLENIAKTGRRITVAFNSYGVERDRLIARAKLVLNLHFYESQLFEIVRVSYLLANRKCVVSETGFDHELETPLVGGIAFAHYVDLTTRCLQLLEDKEERARLSQEGFRRFSALSQIPMLERVLATL